MKFKGIYQKYMLRPLIYLAAFRLMLGLIFLLALEHLVPNGPATSMVAGFLAVLFALFAYLVYLRMDGLRVPRMKYVRPKKKGDPLGSFSSMTDRVDDDPGPTFEELEDHEKDFCSLMANAINLVIFLAASFVV